MKLKIISTALIIFLAIILRGYELGQNPPGVYIDEATQGYNAYSFSVTGKDEYGKSLPVVLRSIGTYPSSLYTYATILPVKFLGLNEVSIRLISLLAGTALVVIAIVGFGSIAGLLVAVTPVFVYFSKAVFETNLALSLLIGGIVVIWKSQKIPKLLPLGFGLLILSTYAYHAERFIAIILILYFSQYFYRRLKNKKPLLIALICAAVLFIPLLSVSFTSGVNSRLYNLSYDGSFSEKAINFIRLYLAYFSPHNLFFKGDPDLQRSLPQLSVFYWWMIIPLIFGIYQLVKKRAQLGIVEKTLLLLLIITPIPASLTKDYFSTTRVVPMFIPMVWIMSLGIRFLLKNRFFFLGLSLLITISLLELYSSLVLLKHQRSSTWNYEYKELAQFINQNSGTPILIDNSRVPPLYILIAFHNKYDPGKFQSQYDQSWLNTYYEHSEPMETVIMDNITVRHIIWEEDIYKDQLIAADLLAISDNQAKEHNLQLVQEIKDINNKTSLRVFKTNPQRKCSSVQKDKALPHKNCLQYINK